ncbi:MAG: hypothetical protein ACJATT_001374 [Myxococcota bacterium]|jgi:hypothetical protein
MLAPWHDSVDHTTDQSGYFAKQALRRSEAFATAQSHRCTDERLADKVGTKPFRDHVEGIAFRH